MFDTMDARGPLTVVVIVVSGVLVMYATDHEPGLPSAVPQVDRVGPVVTVPAEKMPSATPALAQPVVVAPANDSSIPVPADPADRASPSASGGAAASTRVAADDRPRR